MTQTSRPTGQHVDNYPYGDSGPYSSLQWRTVFRTLFTGDDDEGPIGGYLNNLEVTNPIGKTIRVASGAAVVGGNIFFSDANVDFSPPNPTGAARYDYVVACLNDTDTAMTISDAGRTLAFPTDLTDYNGAASIQEYTSRLVIVRGAEGGGLPTLDQNDDHYMIPLASYLISTGGVVSSLTDRREILLSRAVFVPAVGAYNVTDGVEIGITDDYQGGWELPDGKESVVTGHGIIPMDYTGDLDIRVVARPDSGGDAYWNTVVYYADLFSVVTGSDNTGFGNTTFTDLDWVAVHPVTISPTTFPQAGYHLKISTTRRATDVSDDINDILRVSGWLVRYTGRL